MKKIRLLTLFLLVQVALSAQFQNTQRADLVIGQPDLASNTPNNGGLSNASLEGPADVVIDYKHNKLYVADRDNHRVLRYSYPVDSNQAVAEIRWGGSTGIAGTGLSKFQQPTFLAVDTTGRLWVADRFNNVVKWYDEAYAETLNGQAPDGHLITNRSVSGLAVQPDGTLWVANDGSHRVLRYDNATAKAPNDPADGVLGQANFTSTSAATASDRMNTPMGITLSKDGTLWVVDRFNHRILRFDDAANKANGAPADAVLGQTNFTNGGSGLSATAMEEPMGVDLDALGNLYVTDSKNNRVLVFHDAANKANGAAADRVIGQSDFTTQLPLAVNDSTLNTATTVPALAIDTLLNHLWVGDCDNHRVLRYTAASPLAEGVAALGPPNALDFGTGLSYLKNTTYTSNDEFTYELWFNPAQRMTRFFPRQDFIYGDTFARPHLTFNFKGLGEITMGITTTDGNFEVSTTTTGWIDNQWHHIAATYSGGQLKIYANGQLEATESTTGTIIHTLGFFVGTESGLTTPYNGVMDELRIWDRALSATEIDGQYRGELCGGESGLAVYYDFNQGTPGGSNDVIATVTDKSGNGHSAQMVGFAKTGTRSNFVASDVIPSNSIHLEGTSGHLLRSDNSTLNRAAFTYEFYFKPSADINTSTPRQDIIYGLDTTPRPAIIANREGTGTIGLYFVTGGAEDSLHTTTTSWASNTWYHLAFTYDGTAVKVYVNGALENTKSVSGLHDASTGFSIGSSFGATHYYHGFIDELRQWSVARTAAQIADSYQSEITAPTQDLTTYYRFNQGTPGGDNQNISIITDHSGKCNNGTIITLQRTGATDNFVTNTPAALPVALTSFEATLIAEDALLTWQTATEENNAGFEVQKSIDGEHFTTIDFVRGQGTTYLTTDYHYWDRSVQMGINYYRLKQIDHDGAYTYSDIVSVRRLMTQANEPFLHPNPATFEVRVLNMEGPATLYNTLGQAIRTIDLNPQSVIDISDLRAGQYFMRGTSVDGSMQTLRFLKQ